MYTYIYIYTYVYIHIYTYVYTYICIYAYIYIYIYAFVGACCPKESLASAVTPSRHRNTEGGGAYIERRERERD